MSEKLDTCHRRDFETCLVAGRYLLDPPKDYGRFAYWCAKKLGSLAGWRARPCEHYTEAK